MSAPAAIASTAASGTLIGRPDRSRLQVIGDRGALEVQLVAQEARSRPAPGKRAGRHRVVGGVEGEREDDRRRLRPRTPPGTAVGHSSRAICGVGPRRVAGPWSVSCEAEPMPGEVQRRARHPRLDATVDRRRGEGGDRPGLGGEAAVARRGWSAREVGDGEQVEVEALRAQGAARCLRPGSRPPRSCRLDAMSNSVLVGGRSVSERYGPPSCWATMSGATRPPARPGGAQAANELAPRLLGTGPVAGAHEHAARPGGREARPRCRRLRVVP